MDGKDGNKEPVDEEILQESPVTIKNNSSTNSDNVEDNVHIIVHV